MFRVFLQRVRKESPLEILKAISAAIVALSAAFGVIVGVLDYADRVDIERTRVALEMHEAYRKEMGTVTLIDDSERKAIVDRERCILVRKVDEDALADVNCSNLTDDHRKRIYEIKLDSKSRASLRQAIGEALKKELTVDSREAARHYEFFEAVRICANEGICNDRAVLALFAKEMTAYLNQVCAYAEDQNGQLAELKEETKILAHFLLKSGTQTNIFWSEDLSRDQLFICDYLREP